MIFFKNTCDSSKIVKEVWVGAYKSRKGKKGTFAFSAGCHFTILHVVQLISEHLIGCHVGHPIILYNNKSCHSQI